MKSGLVATITLFLIVSIIGCSKDPVLTPEPAPEEPQNPDTLVTSALRIKQLIFRQIDGFTGLLDTDTLLYMYDTEGRVTSRLGPSGVGEMYVYTNGRITSVKLGLVNGPADEGLNYATYSNDGDTIMMDFSYDNPSTVEPDTVQLTYVFEDGQVTDYILHQTGITNRTKFIYDVSRNLTEMQMYLAPGSSRRRIAVYFLG